MTSQATGIPARGDEIAGKYRIERVIGQGGMGAVFAARNTLTGKRVAIKWLLPEHAGSATRDRLLREAQLAGSIAHPNVVDIYDVGEHQGGLFLVMEYLNGRPLAELMVERGRFDPRELISLLVPAMRGVHAAHVAGVIHRDLKPENIILSEVDGAIIPKVVDFGVSKSVGVSAIPNASLTRTGALVGTPHYMAIEQIDGSNIIDPRTDVYGFGVLLYRGLTGTFPFDGSTLGEVILTIGTKEARSMRVSRPDLPEELDAIVLRALARDLQKRFASLDEMARALLPFAGATEVGLHTSWHGATSTGTAVPHVLGVRSAQGATPVDAPAPAASPVAVAARPSAASKRARVAIFAVTALIALIAGALLVPQRIASWLPREASMREEPAQEAVGANVPARATKAAAPALANVAAAAPAQEAAPEQAKSEEAAPTDAVDAVDAETREGEASDAAKPESRRASSPGARRREAAKGQADRDKESRDVIPGRRTQGLSVDDF